MTAAQLVAAALLSQAAALPPFILAAFLLPSSRCLLAAALCPLLSLLPLPCCQRPLPCRPFLWPLFSCPLAAVLWLLPCGRCPVTLPSGRYSELPCCPVVAALLSRAAALLPFPLALPSNRGPLATALLPCSRFPPAV